MTAAEWIDFANDQVADWFTILRNPDLPVYSSTTAAVLLEEQRRQQQLLLLGVAGLVVVYLITRR